MKQRNPPIPYVISWSIRSEISQNKLQSDVENRKDSKCVAERFVNHVPQVENFLCAREEHDALQELGLLGGGVNGPFQLTMRCGQKPKQGSDVTAESQRVPAEARHTELAHDVENHHVRQRNEDG